jgi:hypothetical protein
MTNDQRLAALKKLRKPNILEAFSTRDEFVDWQARVAPLLNFNSLYHSNFVAAADIAEHPSLSSSTINPSLARLDVLMKQAITELEHNLTVVEKTVESVTNPSELDFADICRRLRWKQWLTVATGVTGTFLIGFVAGRFRFFQNLFDLVWNTFVHR